MVVAFIIVAVVLDPALSRFADRLVRVNFKVLVLDWNCLQLLLLPCNVSGGLFRWLCLRFKKGLLDVVLRPFVFRVLEQGVFVVSGRGWQDARLLSAIGSVLELRGVQAVVLLLQLSHLFDFVKIYNVASLHVVEILDALTTEDGRVLAAVKVFDSLLMLMTEVGLQISLIIFVIFVNFSSKTLIEVD